MSNADEHARARAYYDDFSSRYDRGRDRGYHSMLDDLEVGIALPFARGARVCEAGCGTGLILQRLAPVSELAVGFDLSAGMVQRARARGIPAVLGSVTHPPFRPGSFDLVVCFKVLAHVKDVTTAVGALAGLVAPGGRLLLEFYNRWSLRYLAKRLAGPGAISAQRDESDVWTRWITPRELPSLLPPSVELIRYHGVRVWTPAAVAHRVPLIGWALRTAEARSVTSPFRHLAGFLVTELRRR